MSDTFLDRIIVKTRSRVELLKTKTDLNALYMSAKATRSNAESHKFRTALKRSDRINIIAEIKRSSPSKGVINADIDPANVARLYETGGAAAISVLTEPEFFGGSMDDLIFVRKTTQIPILRKDFIVDEFQIYEAAAAGADAILLIVAALSENKLISFLKIAQEELGMDALVEVHTVEELQTAANIGAAVIGVNNRNLHSLEVSLDVSRHLIGERPDGSLMIAESGLSSKDEIFELKNLGFDGFLIGETLMRTGDIPSALNELRGEAA